MIDERNDEAQGQPFDPAPGAIAAQAEVHEGAAPQLALDDDERLPWLESADDEDDDGGTVDTARLLRFIAFGVVLLAGILGALWFVNHRGAGPELAEGSVIKAPAEPYKQVPADRGGKTYAGTGDSAFAVSEGKSTQARLGGASAPVPKPAIDTSADGTSAAGESGVGVQVGAYTSQAAAEAGWTRLSANAALKGVRHRVLQGTADIGTVYRLQAVAADAEAARTLCAALKASGVQCQVKG